MNPIELTLASPDDRQAIYRIRHDVYAKELRQHAPNTTEYLTDELDAHNEYIVAKRAGEVVGFISITPPDAPRYSIDKYLRRDDLSFALDRKVCELRILTVREQHRGTELGLLLMFAALRWAETNAITRIIAIGRRGLLPLYKRIGFTLIEKRIVAGAVEFEGMTATTEELRRKLSTDAPLGAIVARGLRRMAWHLPFSCEQPPPACVHGGEFFKAIGEDLQTLDRRAGVISADVLDAWFPPAPSVIEKLNRELPWLLQTSPPVSASGLDQAISQARGVPVASVLSGAGSSDLIYLAFRAWLSRTSRVLILDPMYGEYAHLCEQNIECHLDRFVLEESADFAFDQVRFERRLQAGYDFIVLVNPNNPTGSYIRLDGIERILALLPTSTTLWIDEAYIDYVSDSTSLESVAAGARNLVVCKSLSKACALSGVRAAYLVGHPETIATLRRWSPPWSVSLPAQLAGIEALKADEYYAARHAETETLRTGLAAGLKSIPGIVVISGLANFLLCRLTSMNRRMFLLECRARGLYLRDVSTMGHSMGIDIFRISVKDQNTNRRMLRIIQDVLANSS